MNKNCPNCGAPYDISLNKCPYCGTSYFDMSTIDFENREPFYLKIKINNMIITQLVRPMLNDIVVEHENTYITGGCSDTMIAAYNIGSRATTNISFEAIPDKKNNNTLVMIKKEN